MIPDQPVTKFAQLNAQFFKDGYDLKVFSIVNDVDVASEESQLKILDFHEKMTRCYLCEETWFKNSYRWRLWYPEFNKFVRDGKCFFKPEGLTIFEKTIPPELFYPCLH